MNWRRHAGELGDCFDHLNFLITSVSVTSFLLGFYTMNQATYANSQRQQKPTYGNANAYVF